MLYILIQTFKLCSVEVIEYIQERVNRKEPKGLLLYFVLGIVRKGIFKFEIIGDHHKARR